MKQTVLAISALILLAAGPAAQQPQQPSDVTTTISSGSVGMPPRFAVPPFIALSKDAETVAAFPPNRC